jgi:beta-glucosidase
VTVSNVGTRAGKYVVQLYVATSAGPVRRPERELRAFAKVTLAPGQVRTVAFVLDRRAFAYWDVGEGGWRVAAGPYRLQVAADAAHVVREATVELAGDPVATQLSLESSVGEWLAHPVVGPALREEIVAATSPEQARAVEQDAEAMMMVRSMPMRHFLVFAGVAVPAPTLARLIDLSRGTG